MRASIKQLLLFALIIIQQDIFAQVDTTRMYIFGHSLLDHRPPLIPTPSDETTVPHWLHLLTEHDNRHYEAAGQYGFLPQHANLPPISQWGYDIVLPAWESDSETFSEVDFSTVLITAGNFMQWQGPDEPYPGEGGMTPVSATEDIVDWLELQEDSLSIYIYENWPDMAPYLSGGSFPPSASDFENYNDYTTMAFHDWWIEYQDSLLSSRPDINVRMIPVGPIMARLFRDTLLTDVPILDLYEDDAPHGRPTVYFLASLISYMAIHNEIGPLDYAVPSIISPIVEENYEAVVNYIWNELNDFNDENGVSRVFYPEAPLPLSLLTFQGREQGDNIEISWTTTSEEGQVQFEIQHSIDGVAFETIGRLEGKGSETATAHYSFIHRGVSSTTNFYRLKQTSADAQVDYSDTIVITLDREQGGISIFPNPVQSRLNIQHTISQPLNFEINSVLGARIYNGILANDEQQIELSFLPKGLYVLKIGDEVFKFLKTE